MNPSSLDGFTNLHVGKVTAEKDSKRQRQTQEQPEINIIIILQWNH